MMIVLSVVIAVQSACLLVSVTEWSRERVLNAALADRNAVQAQALARYHRQDDQRSRFEEECG